MQCKTSDNPLTTPQPPQSSKRHAPSYITHPNKQPIVIWCSSLEGSNVVEERKQGEETTEEDAVVVRTGDDKKQQETTEVEKKRTKETRRHKVGMRTKNKCVTYSVSIKLFAA